MLEISFKTIIILLGTYSSYFMFELCDDFKKKNSPKFLLK